jgi:hypothetical protein
MPNLMQLRGDMRDFGETYWLVDSDYRTQAQGWSRGDRTGPLDLYLERHHQAAGANSVGYVFRTGDYASDAACMQAAVDAMVDFRGDALMATPGNYSPATAVSCDVADMRILGPRCSTPQNARATITAGVASALSFTAAADRAEFGFLKVIPLTATTAIATAAAADNLHFHDFLYDARGITGSTSTMFVTVAGTTASLYRFNNFVAFTDAAQGPVITVTNAASGWQIENFELFHGGGTTLAVALVEFAGALTGCRIENGRGTLTGLASSAVTNLVKLAESGGDISTIRILNFRGSIGFCAAGALVSLNGAEAAETGVAASYLDVVGGGAGGLGTTYTQ